MSGFAVYVYVVQLGNGHFPILLVMYRDGLPIERDLRQRVVSKLFVYSQEVVEMKSIHCRIISDMYNA